MILLANFFQRLDLILVLIHFVWSTIGIYCNCMELYTIISYKLDVFKTYMLISVLQFVVFHPFLV